MLAVGGIDYLIARVEEVGVSIVGSGVEQVGAQVGVNVSERGFNGVLSGAELEVINIEREHVGVSSVGHGGPFVDHVRRPVSVENMEGSRP